MHHDQYDEAVQRLHVACGAQSEVLVSFSAHARLPLLAAAANQWRLVRRGASVGPVRTGAVGRPLAVIEQAASRRVLPHAEELVLSVRQTDAQRRAAGGRGHVLRDAQFPGSLSAALAPSEDVQEGGGGHVLGRHCHVGH